MTISDAPSCGVTYDGHSDYFKDIIYKHQIFKIRDTGGKD